MGVPIVTTRMPGCDDVVEHQVNGLLVEKQDVRGLVNAILILARDDNMRSVFGVESRKRAIELFDLSKIAKQTSDYYQRLISRKLWGSYDHPITVRN